MQEHWEQPAGLLNCAAFDFFADFFAGLLRDFLAAFFVIFFLGAGIWGFGFESFDPSVAFYSRLARCGEAG